MVCATNKPEDARKVLRSLEGMRRFGYELPDDILGEDAIRALEPCLNDRVKAGFQLEAQWNVKADTMVNGLAAKLREHGRRLRRRRRGHRVRLHRLARTGAAHGSRRDRRRPLRPGGGLVDDAAGREARARAPHGAGQGLLVPPPPEGDAEARHPVRGHPRGRHASWRSRADRRHDGVLGLRPHHRPAPHHEPLRARQGLPRSRAARVRGAVGRDFGR